MLTMTFKRTLAAPGAERELGVESETDAQTTSGTLGPQGSAEVVPTTTDELAENVNPEIPRDEDQIESDLMPDETPEAGTDLPEETPDEALPETEAQVPTEIAKEFDAPDAVAEES